MIGVILAAGMAKRLRPLTDTKPKCLLTVGDKTLLQRTVEAMQQTGITEFVVITGYCADQIRNFLTAWQNQAAANSPSEKEGWQAPSPTFRFIHNADYEHNNNIYSLWLAMREVRGSDVLLMDSDILCDPAAVGRVAAESGAALAVNRHEMGEEEMKVVVDADGRITEISKTCSPADAMGESVGIERFTADYGEALADELDEMIINEKLIDIFYERAFERLIPKGQTFKVIDTTDLFSYEIDTPEDYEHAKDLFLSNA